MVYKWKFKQPVPAEQAGKELERLEKKHGHVSPQIVLDASRKKSAPLHPCFEWDDAVAAEKYRLTQAGAIIRSLVVIVDEAPQSEPVRAYVNIAPEKPGTTGEFINVKSALQGESTKEVVLGMALRELNEFQRKYSQLQELAGVLNEIKKLIA